MPNLGEPGSEVPHFIPEPRNFAEVTKLPAYFKNAWLKETLKETKSLNNNKTFLMEDPQKGY